MFVLWFPDKFIAKRPKTMILESNKSPVQNRAFGVDRPVYASKKVLRRVTHEKENTHYKRNMLSLKVFNVKFTTLSFLINAELQ